jgi:hypothetical protein
VAVVLEGMMGIIFAIFQKADLTNVELWRKLKKGFIIDVESLGCVHLL